MRKVVERGIEYTIFTYHDRVEVIASNDTRTSIATGKTANEAGRKARKQLLTPLVDNTKNCKKYIGLGYILFVNDED